MKLEMLPTGRVINEDERTIGRISIHASGKTYRASRINGEGNVDARTYSEGFRSTASALAWIARITPLPMSMVERVWRKDFNNVTKAIHESWTVTDEDGSTYIHPDHVDEPAVRLQRALAEVGYVYGWMD